MTSRRQLLTRSLAAGALLSRDARSFAAANRTVIADDPLRPQFHLLPPRGWMNDPNGPIVWNGQVHLFYQVNPHGGANWEDISWGHAVSSDMVHWRHLPVALKPEAGYADSYGVFSGSCIADGGRCLAFYTAVEKPETPAMATIHDPDKELREQQAVAVSTDPELKHWVKQREPLIATPPLQPTAGFRDPSVWREGDTWYMIVGSGVRDQYGTILLFRATVPAGAAANWQYLHPLVSGVSNERPTPDMVLPGTMWECPDFFELDGYHVLLYSADGKQFWATGTLDHASLTFKPKHHGVVDTGAFYAAKSMTGPHGERILWGWIPEKRPKEQFMAAGWAGAMSLPRVLHISENGALRMSIAPQVDSLLTGPSQTSTSKVHIPGLAAKLHAIIATDGSTVTVHAEDATLLQMRRLSQDRIEINGEIIPAPMIKEITAYIDGSVLELFFGDVAAHTLRSYPALKLNAELTVSLNGGATRITAQAARSISPDRLTS